MGLVVGLVGVLDGAVEGGVRLLGPGAVPGPDRPVADFLAAHSIGRCSVGNDRCREGTV